MTKSLFEQNQTKVEKILHRPLAERMRPRTLEEYIGQAHIIGPGRLLRRAVEADRVSSLILYGPPGTGKTTLAKVIAEHSNSTFISLNAVLSGVKILREEVEAAQRRLERFEQTTILFVDEIHRFNQAQQDALLPWVEKGIITLIGATTENPYFEVNSALNSRSHIFQLKPLSTLELYQVIDQALNDKRGYGEKKISIDKAAKDHWVSVVNGDARSLLNALELAVETTPEVNQKIHISLDIAEASIQERAVLYDRDGDAHFDTVSAFIKSMRGSDPDAALYWLAKMIYAGEPPRQIFRRLLIFASEDVGLAWSQGLAIVQSCAAAFDRVGMPEGRFHLAHATLAMATAPKSNSTMALFDALKSVRHEEQGQVPKHLKDGHRDGEQFGHGQGYLYPHAYQNHWVAQDYLPQALKGKIFYHPSNQGDEKQIGIRVRALREAQIEGVISGRFGDPLLNQSEGLSVSPHEKSLNQWVERAMGDVSAEFAKVRDTLFSFAHLERTSMILDVNAGAGLFTWPATRATIEGGVWSLCKTQQEAELLSIKAKELPWIHQPNILVGDLAQTSLSSSVLEKLHDIQFDLILGRNLLSNKLSWQSVFETLIKILPRPNKPRIIVAEPYLYKAQRLSQLCKQRFQPQTNDKASRELFSLFERWEGIEEKVYHTLPTHWYQEELHTFLSQEFEGIVKVVRHQEIECNRQIRIASERIKQWLSEKPSSYLNHLIQQECSTALVHFIKAQLTNLAGERVNWQVSWILIEMNFE